MHEIVYKSVMRSAETTLDTYTTQISVTLIHVVQPILVFCLKFFTVIPTHFEKESKPVNFFKVYRALTKFKAKDQKQMLPE